MTRETESNGLFQTSHLTLLISYTLFSVALIIESFLMGWEKWMLLLVVVGEMGAHTYRYRYLRGMGASHKTHHSS